MLEERRVFILVYKGSQPSVHLLQGSQYFFSFLHVVFCFAPKIQVVFPSFGEQKERAAGKKEGEWGR